MGLSVEEAAAPVILSAEDLAFVAGGSPDPKGERIRRAAPIRLALEALSQPGTAPRIPFSRQRSQESLVRPS